MIHLRLERRSATPAWLNLLLPLLALAAALILCSGLVALAGADVLDAYAQLFLTPFSTGFDLEQTAIKAAPLVLTGLAVAIAFRARFWNIGGEGQLYAGAVAAAFLGTQLWLPIGLIWPAMILAAALAGAAWALLPAYLRTRFKVDDVVTTLLLNFILLYGISALLDGPWKNPRSAYPTSPPIRAEAEFPILPGTEQLHLGVVVALLAVPVLWFILNRTTFGFAVKAVGENARAAAYAGISAARTILATDIPEAGPEGDGNGKSGQHQRRRLDCRLLQIEASAERREEELGVGVEDIGAGQRHQAAAEDEGGSQRQQRQEEIEPGGRGAAALQAQMDHAAAPGCALPVMRRPMVSILASAIGKSPRTRPSDITAMRSEIWKSSSRSSLMTIRPQPAARSSRNFAWTNWVAPTSSPRVG